MVSPPPHRTNSRPAAHAIECDPPELMSNIQSKLKNVYYLYGFLTKFMVLGGIEAERIIHIFQYRLQGLLKYIMTSIV